MNSLLPRVNRIESNYVVILELALSLAQIFLWWNFSSHSISHPSLLFVLPE